MNAWVDIKLEEITEFKNGFAFKSSDFVDAGVPIIKIKNVKPNKINLDGLSYASPELAESKKDYLIKPTDILITMSGNRSDGSPESWVGKVSLFRLNGDYLLNQRVSMIRAKEEKVDRAFLAYNLSSWDTQVNLINKANSSGGQANISPEIVKNLEISLPSLIEQKAIASVLSSLDDKIDLLHRQNTTLERMAETLFRQWFVEEARVEWEEGTLGEVVEIFDNLRIPLSKMERDKKKDGVLYPYYGAAQIMDYINDYIFDGEFILMGEDGTVRTDEGYPVLQYATGKFWVNNHTHVLKAKPPYSNFLIWNYLSKKNIDEIVTGAVQPKINQGNLKALDFPKLPVHLVHEFNSQTAPMLTKINSNKKQIQTLEKLRDNLLPKLMSGEVLVG